VSQNRALRKTFGPRRDELTEARRKLHSEEFNNLYSSPNISRVIKSRMKWAGHVARMGREERCIWRLWWGNLRERDYLEDPSVDGRIKLSWIFRE